MTRCLACALRDEQVAFDRVVQLFDRDEIDALEFMAAIDACNAALVALDAVLVIEEAQARAWAVVMFDQAFW